MKFTDNLDKTSLFPNAIRLMRARHKLQNFYTFQLQDESKKNLLKNICEELDKIETNLYEREKPNLP